ncbi:NlpC/P60 family protein [uncultured Friedmanniella sp.]|uniref:C40 family peptidase n=1 Tax=uncultured Friedmanniella sp. TaxID=335381 RepID=UPI0035CC524E
MTSRHRGTNRGDQRSSAAVGPRVLRRLVVGGSSLALAVVAFALPGPELAQAAPTALTVAEAKAQIEQLQTESEAIDQQYVSVQQQIDAGKVELSQKQSDVQVQTAKVTQTKRQVGQVALAQFQNRNVDTAARIFFTSDTDNLLSQVSTVEKVSENQNTVLQTYQEQQAALAELEHSTQTDLAVLTDQQKQLTTLRADSEAKVAESKKVLAKLTAAEQAALAAADKKAAADAQAMAEGGSSTTTATTDDTSGTSSITGTGRGAKALAFARDQLGKPYVYAAAGPNSFDCSGLTMKAWQAAGVTIPRIAAAQSRVGQVVSKADLQPGDLVFFYNAANPSHVGMYVGNGQIIHAPHTGSVVKYAALSSMPFVGARRPG